MAEKKKLTQAQKAAQAKKKAAPEKTQKSKPVEKQETAPDVKIPLRFITASVFAALFVVFVVMLIHSDGVLVKLMYRFILGMVGRTGFYIMIPVLLYLFMIHAFSGKRPVLMRSICLGVLVLCIGSIAHLYMQVRMPADQLPKGFAYLGYLYSEGINGNTGGLICGLIASGLNALLGQVISYIGLGVAALFTILGAMQITIPSLVRAFRDRPRADWEDVEDKPEPASIVVNHLANKRIEHMESKRRKVEQKQQAIADDEPDEPVTEKPQKPIKTNKTVKKQQPVVSDEVSAAEPVTFHPEPVFVTPQKPEEITIVDSNLQPLDRTEQHNAGEFAKEKVTAKDAEISAAQVAAEIAQQEEAPKPEYHYPPIDLLALSTQQGSDYTEEMRENAQRLNEALESYSVSGRVINATRGPSVTRYEVELARGVKLSRVTNAAKDLALSLGVSGVRITTVVGKISVIGIEVPNQNVTTVTLREVIDSKEFSKAKSKSSFAVGKDIGGKCIVGDITKLPHMLIAGTTGSGKSVCMNSIIISLLYKSSPEDVKLIMVDPKMVELGVYNGIPHLLIPVVTDSKKAAGSLQWAVTEMMRRYKAMYDRGVRDLETYNSVMEAEEGPKLPQIVVIIDELADLMLVAAKEVEESICRIAQMGRAAGIHLLIATQRPSADVITGLMKANIPSRIAFAVSSAMESRIILDTGGAESLVGRGDMLYAPIGCGKPLRVQGCFVDNNEVEKVANYVKEKFSTEYDQGVMEEIERKASQTGNGKSNVLEPEPNEDELEYDEMLPQAVEVVLQTGQASVSMLQRRLKLGYSRAARIVDEMAELGIVGPYQGSKPRAVLITREQWELKNIGQTQQLSMDEMEEAFDPEA